MGTPCPTCDRDDFGSEQAMKIHHFQSHGESISNWEVKEFTCEWCEEAFQRELPEGESQRFCSNRCASKWMHDKNGNEIREHSRLARKEALIRDDYTCQRCGCEVESGHRESPQSAEAHHIIPRRAGGPNVPSNLVTLCLRCHKEVHQEMGDIHKEAPGLLEDLRDVICSAE